MLNGMSHVRYDHRSRPSKIEVVCPKCEAKAIATVPCYDTGIYICNDLCPHWQTNDWSVACTNCTFRAFKQSYSELGKFYYQVEARGHTLWAWNREHLVMLYNLLSNKPIDKFRYGWFATYARKEWLKGSRKKSFAKAVDKMLKE